MILVSAILPTRGRKEYAKRAVECFRKQTYPHRELVILDDEEDPSFSQNDFDVMGIAFTYLRHAERLTIPQKRNRCIEHASGDIIMHFDSDDFSAPGRMTYQVERLLASGREVHGFHNMLFYDEDKAIAWWYHSMPPHAIGTSLTFTYEWWQTHQFKPGHRNVHNICEDVRFSMEAVAEEQLTSDCAGALMVARIHSGNTSPKHIDVTSCSYDPIPIDRIPSDFFA